MGSSDFLRELFKRQKRMKKLRFKGKRLKIKMLGSGNVGHLTLHRNLLKKQLKGQQRR
jgi:hypothetical protein